MPQLILWMSLNLLLKEMILFLISKHKKDLLFILEVLATSASVDTSDDTESAAESATIIPDSQEKELFINYTSSTTCVSHG